MRKSAVLISSALIAAALAGCNPQEPNQPDNPPSPQTNNSEIPPATSPAEVPPATNMPASDAPAAGTPTTIQPDGSGNEAGNIPAQGNTQ